MESVIEIRGATKDYGKSRGVFDLSLEVGQGEVVGFLGANGAGKSVTMRMLMGFVRPRQGSVRIFGRDCFSDRAEIQKSVGYLPGELAFPGDMTAAALLRFTAAMAGIKEDDCRCGCARGDELADFFELDVSAHVRSMSKGTRQKVGIVAAFMGRPQLLLLDEPTSGLDLLMQRRFVELVQAEKRRGTTILLSSHLLGEVEGTCDRAVFIRNGHVVYQAQAQELTLDSTLRQLYGPQALNRHWREASADNSSGDVAPSGKGGHR